MKGLLDKKNDAVLGILDSISIPAFIIDSREKIVALNASAQNVFQYAPPEIAGEDISTIISFNRSMTEISHSLPGVLSGHYKDDEQEGLHFESYCKKKNGELFVAKISVIPSETDSRSLVVIQDISDQKMLQKRASQRTKELSVFNTFAKILTGHRDTDMIMQETIEMLLLLMEADGGWIYLVDDETGELHLAVQKGITDDLCDGGGGASKHRECFTGKVFSSGRPLLVKNASEDPRVACSDGRIESMAGIPISSKGLILGALGVASQRTSHFTSMDIQLLKTIGSQLGVAIENSRLIGQLRVKMKQIRLINELSGIINSSLSIGTVFRIMMQEIGKLIDYDRGSILLYNENRDNLLIFALDTGMKTVLKKGVRAPTASTSAGWALKNNLPLINYDLTSDLKFSDDRKLLDEGIRSTISIPLFQDKVIGVFNLDSTAPFKYSENDLELLLPVAKHISIALENALLFEEISREKKEWEKTFDAITDMVWIKGKGQGVIRANHALFVKTGFSNFEIQGKQCREILNKIGIHNIGCMCSDTISTKKPSFQEIRGAGGSIFHFWAYPLIDEEGHLYAIVHYLKDVTSQRLLEQQLIRADKLASLGTLVAGIAHEINNPLGIIAGYSEALLDRSQDERLMEMKEFEDFPEYLGTIHNEIFRCKGILQSLLEFARPHGATFRDLDINELIKEVILLVNHKAARLRHNIELKLNRDLPKICGDPGSLRQLFMNIIINSIYFTPEGGSIIIRTDRDSDMGDQRFGIDTERVRVSIEDTGTGIPDDIIGKIFDPFLTTKPVGEGTGLGLAISHKIVEEHGGSIDVESEAGKGTKFTIKFAAKTTDDKSTRN